MLPENPNDVPKVAEKIALWFAWLVVIGGVLLSLGMLLLHEHGPHG